MEIHTHYDGQATWDPAMTPLSRRGVATTISGSCGVGFAPVRPGSETFLINLHGTGRGESSAGSVIEFSPSIEFGKSLFGVVDRWERNVSVSPVLQEPNKMLLGTAKFPQFLL